MADYLPTLKGLQAFEAVYQFNSFTDAAKALNVQQPAISYQIRTLEDELGVRLFTRRQGRLAPTPDGDALFETVSHAFDSVRAVARRIRETRRQPSMTIATYPGIATFWLASRLGALTDPLGRTARVITLTRDVDLLRERADCWILFGSGTWRDLEARLLFAQEVCPVAAPAVAARIAEAGGAQLPPGVKIIELEDPERRWLNWDDWRRRQPEGRALDGPRVTVNDHGLALHMALAGAGVTLGWTAVIEDLLAGGSLVRLSEAEVSSDAGYWLLGRPGFFDSPLGAAVLSALTGP